MTAAFVVGLASAAAAQDDTMEVLREKVRADKKLLVAVALDLSESEAKTFWPVYNAYQSDMIEHYNRVMKLISNYAAAYKTMTDDTASQLLGQFLSLETAHAALLNGYLPKLQNALPPKKVARFYQVENKLRALVNYELARDIPLIK
ncbi:MAG: hypothetical protein DME02_04055 [Candidatus Rokuibacteriota bacterium]|nr:MAG: hypothetical protein DME02_04055 [Candidatus Rokubacteria bacterium]